MTRIELDGWVLECDVEATREAYDRIAVGDPETCTCAWCRNFIAVRDLAYPAPALDLYARLGITASKEAETYEAGPVGGGQHLYCGWHHFIGHVLKDPGTTSSLSANFNIFFREERSCAEPVFDERPLVQAEFSTTVPWVIPEQPLEKTE